ncbi:MAG: FAD-dependent oxidoreductase [Candidatus Thorarchaeota archaeon]|nr:FAD-dependent oxidoreductase [Candidatus Thorarchaeota archaeon]TFH07841.1 MAG: thioredoxin reductase [Candidatus Thorarchaeota archaeon]
MYDLVVIGAGVTGYGAAMYAARLDLSVVVLGDVDGGTITLTDDVANYPGFIQLTGKELSDNLKAHTLDYPVLIETGTVKDIFRSKENFFYIVTENKSFLAKSILIATGMKERELEVPGHDELKNRGVSYCALCDAPLYKDKVVAVIGGSDSAAKEALLLAKYCPKVYIIYRREHLRPEPINGRRIERESKIEVITETNITEILGETKVTGVKLDKPFNGSDILPLDGVFVAIGGIPYSELAKKLGAFLNEKGEIKIDRSSRTNVEGVFAAGDVVDSEFKQAITGVAEGVHAAYQAYKYVNENEFVFTCQRDE